MKGKRHRRVLFAREPMSTVVLVGPLPDIAQPRVWCCHGNILSTGTADKEREKVYRKPKGEYGEKNECRDRPHYRWMRCNVGVAPVSIEGKSESMIGSEVIDAVLEGICLAELGLIARSDTDGGGRSERPCSRPPRVLNRILMSFHAE